MTPDFNTMPKKLRAYVVAHPTDLSAFQMFVDRFTAEASSEVFDLPRSEAEVEEVNSLIQRKLDQS